MIAILFSALVAATGTSTVVVPTTEITHEEEELIPRWEGKLRFGGGADTNVLHEKDANEQGGLIRVEGLLVGEPTKRLHLQLGGNYEQHAPLSAINEGEVMLYAAYRQPITEAFSVSVGSLSAFRRELSVFAQGSVRTRGAALRNQIGEHIQAALELALGDFDIIGGLRGDLKSVSKAENYTLYGFEAGARIRYVPTSFFAVKAGYGFDYRMLDGFRAPNPGGAIVEQSPDLKLTIHVARAAVRMQPIEGLGFKAGYELEHNSDNFLGFLDGIEHHLKASVVMDWHKRFFIELGGELIMRDYPKRTLVNQDNQNKDQIITASADFEYWFTDLFGVYLRYQLEHDSVDPAGLLFVRHAATIGPAARLRWDGGDRFGW